MVGRRSFFAALAGSVSAGVASKMDDSSVVQIPLTPVICHCGYALIYNGHAPWQWMACTNPACADFNKPLELPKVMVKVKRVDPGDLC